MIEQSIVKVPFRKLKHIHHISDIQIRNLKRHKEYEEVFERTYEEVRKNKDNAVAYIGGDIAHSKTEMSPELIDQLSRLFKNLADICPTIIIAGNHDCNLNNLNRMDCLTPIVENFMNHNIDVYFVKLTEKDPSDLGFEKVTKLLKETNKTKFSDLMRMRLNGRTKKYMEI